MRRLIRRVRRRIAFKLTLTLVVFVALAILAGGLYLRRALEEFAVASLEARLALAGVVVMDEARGALDAGRGGRAHEFVARLARSTTARVTLIGPDGRVLAESERAPDTVAALDNHRDRPEVRGALAGEQGRDIRRSTTLGVALLYVALPVRDAERIAGVLRLALPLSVVTDSYGPLHQVMLGGAAVALAVTLAIGLVGAARVVRPVVEMQSIARLMSEGHFDVRAPTRSPDEIGTLGRSLNVLAARIREKMQDLAREQARAAAILESMVEGVVVVDAHERLFLINGRAREMLGIIGPGWEGRPLLEVVRHADIHEALGTCQRARPAGVVRREVRLGTPAERVIALHATPVTLTEAGPGTVMVLNDITELRRLEQVRSEFVANVSHELRTPLTAIRGYLETLLGGALEEPEHARRFLDIALRHTERLGRLLDDLTDLSNIELGRVRLRIEPLDVQRVVDSVLAIMAPRAESGEVALESHLPADAPRVAGDHDRLVQILLNLVDNAVKYTPRGGRVSVGARYVASDTVELSVVDTGIGIPPGDIPRITERFYRVDRARSRELGGTGLGLAIVKHLVMAHGGRLAVESQPGRGTTVRFTLPVVAMAEPSTPPPRSDTT
jgi:two-component system phosphate regulon sensor histidine kinase PhoR